MPGIRDLIAFLLGDSGKGNVAFDEEEKARGSGQNQSLEERILAPVYRQGDKIAGRHVILKKLGEGAFGTVYLVRTNERLFALKTVRPELLKDSRTRQAFRKEIEAWVQLEDHPFILPAEFVEEIGSQLFVHMEYVAPDDVGRITLQDYLTCCSDCLPVDQILKWAIQFSMGMEHANARGIVCHRDIKPCNILIGKRGDVRISDFGLAVAVEEWTGTDLVGLDAHSDRPWHSILKTEGRRVCGTPGYIPPEFFYGKKGDVRSDIYSFGLVLWQMCNTSPLLPFRAKFRGDVEAYAEAILREQLTCRIVPPSGPIGAIVERCLEVDPTRRPKDFTELRCCLEQLLRDTTGDKIELPTTEQSDLVRLADRGSMLSALGKQEEAIACLEKVLERDPKSFHAWNEKGVALGRLGLSEQAMASFEQSIKLCPNYYAAWGNKGNLLAKSGQYEEALSCFDVSLRIEPRFCLNWAHKGRVAWRMGRFEEAIICCDKALDMDPNFHLAWAIRGLALLSLGRNEEALLCHNKALEIDALDVVSWRNKGDTLWGLGRDSEALQCYDKALEIDDTHAPTWAMKAFLLFRSGRYEEAVTCSENALRVDPLQSSATQVRNSAREKLRLSGDG